MKLTIVNTGTQPTTLAGDDIVACLAPGESLDITCDAQVLIYGPKPDVIDQFKKVATVLKALIARTKPEPNVDVAAMVTNTGENPVRVILGDGVTDTTMPPQTSFSGSAMYLELRELGNAPQQGGTPD